MNKWWSFLFGTVMLACLGLFLVAPFVGWWLPRNVSSFGADVDALFYLILGITTFFFIVTEALLVYFMYVYAGVEGKRPPAESDAKPSVFAPILRPITSIFHDQHRVEMAWTVVPAIILLYIAFAQIGVWEHIKDPANMPKEPDVGVEVSARLFEWRIRYPGTRPKGAQEWQSWAAREEVDDLHTVNELHTWTGANVKVFLKTRDVIHSFYLPNLRLKQDALPGKTIPVWFNVTDYNTVRVDKNGDRVKFDDPRGVAWRDGYSPAESKFDRAHQTWELACAELCGWGHFKMSGKLYVHENEKDYRRWLRAERQKQNSTQTEP